MHVIPLFGPSDGVFEKTAAPTLLPEVVRYIEQLRPRNDAQYVLLNALGAGEWWGANVNGDYFPEASLIHAPDDWRGVPVLDKLRSKDWPYGFPTFYYAKPFLHHRNKDYAPFNHPAYGEVELAAWNDRMKRVELVARVDKHLCEKHGGTGIWDKLKMGQFVDVSMGTKVPFDTCSVCLDARRYQKALATFQRGRHKSPGDAVLEVHKKDPIRGVAVTRKNYCEHALSQMNRILPDGRKVYVVNDFPRFFDISFVFIGADKTAKVMLKIAGEGENAFWKIGLDAAGPKTQAADEKVASSFEEAILGKDAAKKEGEMTKDVIPSQFAAKAVPVLNKREPDLSRDILDGLATRPLPAILSTATGMGMVLRPREFQRIVLIQMRRREDADLLDRSGCVFPRVEEEIETPMGGEFFSPVLARLLSPLMRDRSALRPILEKRILVLSSNPAETEGECSSLSSPLLHKISAAYNGYRVGAMRLVEQAGDMMSSAAPLSIDFHKLASSPNLFSPLSKVYFETAYWGEIDKQANAGVERELPSGNTWSTSKKVTGGT